MHAAQYLVRLIFGLSLKQCPIVCVRTVKAQTSLRIGTGWSEPSQLALCDKLQILKSWLTDKHKMIEKAKFRPKTYMN